MSVCEKCGLPACGNECLGEIRDDILHASYGSRTSNRRVIDDLESKLAEANFDKRYLSDQLAAVTKERDELLSVLRTAYDDCVQHDDDSAGTRALVQFTLAQYPELPNPGGVHGPKCTGPFAPDCRCK